MANEATLLEVNELEYRQLTVGDATAINKGTLMVITVDPNTGREHGGTINEIPVGFSAVEKTANDGQTTLPCQVRGDVDAVADGAITIGKLVCPGTVANRVREFGAASIEKLDKVMGHCLETASDGEKVRIRLMLG